MCKIKFCGITQENDCKVLAKMLPDYLGFIFYSGSLRNVSPSKVRKFKTKQVLRVGVFVNEAPEVIKDIFYEAKLDIVQLHGEESPGYCESLGLPYWKVFKVKNSENDFSYIKEYQTNTIVLDTFSKDLKGGTGIAFEPFLIEEVKICTKKNIIVAGGVNINNIQDILKYKPFGVDINSGIEKMPGMKDSEKAKQIIEKIREFVE